LTTGGALNVAGNSTLTGEVTVQSVSGVEKRLSKRVPTFAEVNSWLVSDGSTITMPDCGPSGAPSVFVTPQQIGPAFGTPVAVSGFQIIVTPSNPANGQSVTVHILDGNATNGFAASYQSLARVFCQYN
jgi:hypothetical protein